MKDTRNLAQIMQDINYCKMGLYSLCGNFTNKPPENWMNTSPVTTDWRSDTGGKNTARIIAIQNKFGLGDEKNPNLISDFMKSWTDSIERHGVGILYAILFTDETEPTSVAKEWSSILSKSSLFDIYKMLDIINADLESISTIK